MDEYNNVIGLDNAKEIWDTLIIAREGNDTTMSPTWSWWKMHWGG
jgi:hypothetical protein